jgi:hypothetical protein
VSWKCNLPSGKSVLLDDLPIEVFADIATAEGLAPSAWYELVNAPAVNGRAAVRLLAACAEHVGDEPPPAGYITGGSILKVFEKARDELPSEYSDGMPIIDPKDSPDDPETT